MSEKNKKSFTKGTWNVFKQINRLINACKIEEKETESSKWFQNHAFITFGGAFLCTFLLLCMLVSIKGDARQALGMGTKKKEDETMVMCTI